jgi:hypothetical protein
MSYVTIARGATEDDGFPWEVGVGQTPMTTELVITVGPTMIGLSGEQCDRFAEAVARAVTPGQVSG